MFILYFLVINQIYVVVVWHPRIILLTALLCCTKCAKDADLVRMLELPHESDCLFKLYLFELCHYIKNDFQSYRLSVEKMLNQSVCLSRLMNLILMLMLILM